MVAAEAFLEFEDTEHTRECLEVYFGESVPLGDAAAGQAEAPGSSPNGPAAGGPAGSTRLDQFYVRALFVNGCLMQRSAVVDDNLRGQALHAQTVKSAQCIIHGIELALSPALGLERYKFLVYNGSVHFWRITRFLQTDGLRRALLPQLQKVVDAIAAVDAALPDDRQAAAEARGAPDGAAAAAGGEAPAMGGAVITKRGVQEWHARNLISLALCHIEAGRQDAGGKQAGAGAADALKCLDAALQLTRVRATRKEVESLRLHFLSAKSSVAASGQSDADSILAAELRLLALEEDAGGGKQDAAAAAAAVAAGLRAAVDELEKTLKESSFRNYRSLVLGPGVRVALKNVEAQAAWIAAKRGCEPASVHAFVRSAIDCDDLKARLRAKLAVCLLELRSVAADGPDAGAQAGARAARARRYGILKQLEVALVGYLKSIQNAARLAGHHPRADAGAAPVDAELKRGVHDCVKLVWNASLPLLDHRLFTQEGGGIVRSCFKLSTRALEAIHSNNAFLRASLHMEVAQHVIESPTGAALPTYATIVRRGCASPRLHGHFVTGGDPLDGLDRAASPASTGRARPRRRRATPAPPTATPGPWWARSSSGGSTGTSSPCGRWWSASARRAIGRRTMRERTPTPTGAPPARTAAAIRPATAARRTSTRRWC